jgi:two-component system phosphate regulon sensor histidine kinase PhoR
MLYNSKLLASALSAIIVLITAVLFSFFVSIPASVVLTVLLIGFCIVFLLLYWVLEILFFRRIQGLKAAIKSFSPPNTDAYPSPARNTLEEIGKDVESPAAAQQREIERLKKLEAFRKDFIADISHELKTPIFAAQGFVHTLLDGAVKEKAVRKKFLKKAAKSLDGLDMLVQDLLTLSLIETGQIKMRFQEIDLYSLTMDVFDQFKQKCSKKGITLKIDGPVRRVLVHADWQRISQVMTNLISNAIKYTAEGGEVIITFSIRKKSVITRVRDFGEGVPEEDLQRIFERFYRVDKSRSREKGGTGLGLAIVKHILEGHNSYPEVETAPGKGSTFSFKLPRHKNEDIEDTEHHESTSD